MITENEEGGNATVKRQKPQGRIVQVHESTIQQLLQAADAGLLDQVREIAVRLSMIDQRAQVRAVRDTCYRLWKEAKKNGDEAAAEDATRKLRICEETLDHISV